MFRKCIRHTLVAALVIVGASAIFGSAAEAQSRECGRAVTVGFGDTLFRIAQRCGTTVGALMAANPQLPSQYFLLPGMRIQMPAPPPPPSQGNIIRYTVRPGDSLLGIARRYGVSLPEIYRLNPNIDAASMRPGDVIRLPGGIVPPQPSPPPGTGTVRYTVRPGDTLSSIARRYDVRRTEIRRLNPGIEARPLRVGDVIRLPAGVGAPPPPPPPPPVNTSDYIVRPGDTIYSIARANGMSVGQILELNPRLDPSRLRVGDVIRLRGGIVPPAPPSRDLRVTGTLTREGAECQAMRSDDGRLYTLAGRNLGDFFPGDRVQVEGRVAEISTCMQGTTIDVSRIRPAQ